MTGSILTIGERRNINIGRVRHQSTFPRYTDCCPNVVACAHPNGQVGGSQSVNGRGSRFLELVLKDDESQELQAAFRLLPERRIEIRVNAWQS